MKKLNFNKKKLSLNKETISKLNDEQMGQANGGWFTQGCTDGCGGDASAASFWRCTRGGCTGDCNGRNSAGVCRTVDGACRRRTR